MEYTPQHLSRKNFSLQYAKPMCILNLSLPTLFVTDAAITIPHTSSCTRDRQISVATALRAERPGNRNSILCQCTDFSHLHSGQNGSGAHPASYPTGKWVLSPVVQQPRRQTDHSPTSALRLSTASESWRRVWQRYFALVRMRCC